MIYRFADVELDVTRHRLLRAGMEVHSEPQVFDLIAALAREAPNLLSYDALIEEIWNGRIVSDATISTRISAARNALGDTGKAQDVIRTVPRRGIQLVPAVQIDAEQVATVSASLRASPSAVRLARSADGSSIAWSSSGDGPPLLRAGHWLTHVERDLKSPLWGPWIEGLNAGRRLIRYDPRGTGLSGPECGALSIARGVEDMIAVLDAAEVEKTAIFAASQSAAIAFSFALAHPDRVSKIATWAAFVQGSRVRDAVAGDTLTDALNTMIEQGWGQPRSSYARMLAALFMPEADKAMIDHLLELQMASAGADRAVAIREMCSRYDVVDLLADLTVPILAAHGTGDTTHPFDQSRLIATHAPDARLLGIETNNHVLSPEEPGFTSLMDAINLFLAD